MLCEVFNYFTDNFASALELFLQISSLLEKAPLNGARSDTLLKCEINQVLLILILRPAPQNIPANLAKILEKYTWADNSDKNRRGILKLIVYYKFDIIILLFLQLTVCRRLCSF